MLRYFAINGIQHPCMRREGKWLGNSLDEFLDNLPPPHLLNQLFMFSPDFDIHQAVARVNAISHYISGRRL